MLIPQEVLNNAVSVKPCSIDDIQSTGVIALTNIPGNTKIFLTDNIEKNMQVYKKYHWTKHLH